MKLLAIAILNLMLLPCARAATVRVPADHPTIVAAMDAAAPGDTVLVSPAGTYTHTESRLIDCPGGLDWRTAMCFPKAGVLLKAEQTGTAVLDLGGQYAYVARYCAAAAGSVTIEGFVFRNTHDERAAVTATGLGSALTTVTIRECLFENGGHAVEVAGCTLAVVDSPVQYCESPWPKVWPTDSETRIERCAFVGNVGSYVVWARGGEEHTVTIRDTEFRDHAGPCTLIQFAGAAIVENNFFLDNDLGVSVSGTQRGTRGPAVSIRGNTFVRSSVGVQLEAPADGEIVGNTFDSCSWVHPGSAVLIWLGDGQGPTSFRDNVVTRCSGEAAVALRDSGTPPSVSCNLYWANSGGDAADDWPIDPSDVFSDPLYCRPLDDFDFTVAADSPCVSGNAPGCGQIGAWGIGCAPTAVERTSWGMIKQRFR